VPKGGVEPPHPCGYMVLNHARLPFRHFGLSSLLYQNQVTVSSPRRAQIPPGGPGTSVLREPAIANPECGWYEAVPAAYSVEPEPENRNPTPYLNAIRFIFMFMFIVMVMFCAGAAELPPIGAVGIGIVIFSARLMSASLRMTLPPAASK
jgi:hypothetical protein